MAVSFTNAAASVGTSPVNLYTCPASTAAVVHGLFLSNVDGSNSVNVTVSVQKASPSITVKVGYLIPVPGGATLQFDKAVNLLENDILQVVADAAGDLEAFASIMEKS